MKKINILKNNREFTRIITNNKPFKYKDYLVYIEKNEDLNYQFGISVSKKICNAVGRNKIKRQMKSIIDKKNYQKGFNCIIIIKRGILNRSYQEMEQNLFECFSKINILKGENNEK